MAIATSISRFGDYFKRHGFKATIRRMATGMRRALLSNRQVVFCCDLSRQVSSLVDLPTCLKIERTRSAAEVEPRELAQIINIWNPKLAQRNMKGRFDAGASLWLVKSEDGLAGYGWTLQGHTMEPHYIPLGPRDVHLFDFYVLPPYRGRGINPLLVSHILRRLERDGVERTFIEAAAWNRAQLLSLAKTPFCYLGCARKFTFLGRTIVCWDEKSSAGRELYRSASEVADSASVAERSTLTTRG